MKAKQPSLGLHSASSSLNLKLWNNEGYALRLLRLGIEHLQKTV
jgi:hypothetical protein